MCRNVGILMLGSLLLTGCGGAAGVPGSELASLPVDAGPALPSTCASDGDCPAGMLCEACASGFATCVPGCRDDAQCGQFQRCNHNVQCLTCPCPSGLCDLDPCRDADGDGYAATDEGACPGKELGDCDDTSPAVHPGARERCANYADDDCDRRRDANDSECSATCDVGERRCNGTADCSGQGTCEAGCCEACPVLPTPVCGVDQCLLPGGLDSTGCTVAQVCGACVSCSLDYVPVCGTNFATYSNACLARAAGAEVLHDGSCVYREGLPCEERWDCGSGELFCREVAPGDRRCAKVGTCTADADCAYVTQVVPCGDAGVAPWVCRAGRCNATCAAQ